MSILTGECFINFNFNRGMFHRSKLEQGKVSRGEMFCRFQFQQGNASEQGTVSSISTLTRERLIAFTFNREIFFRSRL